MVTCNICKKEFEEDAQLHKHVKAHGILVAEYYQTQFPRYDKHDGALIKFKNKKQYFQNDFNSRLNLKLWLQNTDTECAREYCKELLVARQMKKNLVWAPTQVELRSTMMPPIQEYMRLFGDYYKLCADLGMQCKHSSYELFQESLEYSIYIDTREQAALTFPNRDVEIASLQFGDYYSSLHNDIFIERKAVNDLIHTLSGGYLRFQKEIIRAKEAQCYLVVVIEDNINNVLDFKKIAEVYKKGTKVQPEYVFHNIRELCQIYDNIQFVFANGRKEAARVVESIFNSADSVKDIDLQFAYDTKQL